MSAPAIYGTVIVRDRTVQVTGTPYQLHDWAHRCGAAWPCSELARSKGTVTATFDPAGLLDLRVGL